MSLRPSPRPRTSARPEGPGRRPRLGRLAVLAAGGALALLTAAAPATAAPPADPTPATPSVVPGSSPPATGSAPAVTQTYWGRVTARTGLVLRDAPNRSARVVRTEPYGAVVPIYCKTIGENVDGNNRWYILTDGTWAWGSARYIKNIGTPPRWC